MIFTLALYIWLLNVFLQNNHLLAVLILCTGIRNHSLWKDMPPVFKIFYFYFVFLFRNLLLGATAGDQDTVLEYKLFVGFYMQCTPWINMGFQSPQWKEVHSVCTNCANYCYLVFRENSGHFLFQNRPNLMLFTLRIYLIKYELIGLVQ